LSKKPYQGLQNRPDKGLTGRNPCYPKTGETNTEEGTVRHQKKTASTEKLKRFSDRKKPRGQLGGSMGKGYVKSGSSERPEASEGYGRKGSLSEAEKRALRKNIFPNATI